MVNLDLKIAIMRRWGTQLRASRALDIPESKISYFINGLKLPNPREREILNRELGAELVEKLFTEDPDLVTKPAA